MTPIASGSSSQVRDTTSLSSPLSAIAVLGGIQAAAMVLNLARSKVVAVTVGPAGMGAVALIDQVVTLSAQLAAFSLPVAGVKFLSMAHSEDREEFATLYAAFFRILLFLSVAMSLVGVALLVVMPGMLGPELAQFRTATVLGLLAIPAVNLSVLLTNTLASVQRTSASGLYGLATSVGLATLCAAGVSWAGVRGYYLANFAAMALVVLGGVVYLLRRERLSAWIRAAPRLGDLRRRKIWKFSAAMYITSFTGPLSDLLVRYAVLNAGGLAATGVFQAASGLGLSVRSLVRPSFGLFLTPALNRKGLPDDKLQEAARFLRVLTILIGICALPLVMFPKGFLRLLYAPEFASASPTVYLFVAGIGLQLFATVNVALLLGLDDVRGFVWTSATADLATAVFAWWLAPRLGIQGVALAFILDGFTVFVLSTGWLWWRHRLATLPAAGWLPLGILTMIVASGALSLGTAGDRPAGIMVKILAWLIFVVCCSRFAPVCLRGFFSEATVAAGFR